VAFSAGNLSVTGSPTSGTLTLTRTATGVQVQDGATNLGTYAVTGNTSVTTGNTAATVNLNITAGQSLPGNLTVTTGNGNDAVNINGVGGTGTVAGRVVLALGDGNDAVRVASTGPVTLAGMLQVDGGLGND